jgi:hypothetical protein
MNKKLIGTIPIPMHYLKDVGMFVSTSSCHRKKYQIDADKI